jgi:hypothetical protein
MPNFQALECDLITAASGQTLCTVQLPGVPRVGDEIDVDAQAAADGLYRVVGVRYHVRPRKFTTRDDLFGVSVFVEPAA